MRRKKVRSFRLLLSSDMRRHYIRLCVFVMALCPCICTFVSILTLCPWICSSYYRPSVDRPCQPMMIMLVWGHFGVLWVVVFGFCNLYCFSVWMKVCFEKKNIGRERLCRQKPKIQTTDFCLNSKREVFCSNLKKSLWLCWGGKSSWKFTFGYEFDFSYA